MTRLIIGLLLTCSVCLGIVAVRHAREAKPPDPAAITLALDAPAGAVLGSGDEPLDAAISHAGDELVFVATREGQAQLWHRDLEDGHSTPLAGTEGAALPAWKIGAQVVSFFSGRKLKAVHLPSQRISELADAAAPGGATWLADGSLLYVPAPGPVLRMTNGRVSAVTRLTAQERTHALPIAWDGHSFTYVSVRNDGERFVRFSTLFGLATRNGSEQPQQDVELGATTGHGQLVGNHLLYTSGDALVARTFSSEQRSLIGRPIAVAPRVGVTSVGRAMFAASPALLATAPQSEQAHQIIWVTAGDGLGTALSEPGDYWQVRVAPNEGVLAVTAVHPQLRSRDIYLVPLAEPAKLQRLTLSLDADSDPVWLADGSRVWFKSWQGGVPQVFSRRAAVSADPDETVAGTLAGDTPADFTSAGLLVHAPGAASGLDIWLIDRRGQRQQITRSAFNEWDARWSPNGRWLAYVSDESGNPDVYIQPWPEGPRIRASSGGGTQPVWSPDSRRVYFVRGSRIMRVNLDNSGPTPQTSIPESTADLGGRIRGLAITPQTGRLIAIVPAFAASAGEADVLLNWQTIVTRAAREQERPRPGTR